MDFGLCHCCGIGWAECKFNCCNYWGHAYFTFNGAPIIGAGFGLGIYDFNLLKKSLKNLFIATIVSLLVSTIYFFLSPFKDV